MSACLGGTRTNCSFQYLGRLYDCQVVMVSPREVGVPNSRPRKFLVACLRSCGYFKHPLDCPTFGIARFFKILNMTGDDLFMAPQDEVTAYFKQVAETNKVP